MIDEAKIRQGIALMLAGLGIDGQGTEETPRRVAMMYREIFSGVDQDPATALGSHFNEETDGLVIVRDIPFYSMCEHHLVPFFGKAHIAYLPQNGIIAGFGRLAAVVEIFARRPQLQERLTREVAELLMENLGAAGVMVVVEAEHMCVSMRGVNKTGVRAVTTVSRGTLADDALRRAEAAALLRPTKGNDN